MSQLNMKAKLHSRGAGQLQIKSAANEKLSIVAVISAAAAELQLRIQPASSRQLPPAPAKAKLSFTVHGSLTERRNDWSNVPPSSYLYQTEGECFRNRVEAHRFPLDRDVWTPCLNHSMPANVVIPHESAVWDWEHRIMTGRTLIRRFTCRLCLGIHWVNWSMCLCASGPCRPGEGCREMSHPENQNVIRRDLRISRRQAPKASNAK